MYSDYRERHISVVGIHPGVTLEYHTITGVKLLARGQFGMNTISPLTTR